MTLVRGCRASAIVAGLMMIGGTATAQTTVAARETRPAIDTKAAEATLERMVTVHLSSVPVRAAIDAVAKKTGTRVFYESRIFDRHQNAVTVHADSVALKTVFSTILAGTRLRVAPVANGALSVQENEEDSVRASAGTIAGTVTDAKTKRAIRSVNVILDDSSKAILTDEKGQYRFTNVAAGEHRVTVRHVGYRRQTTLVTVADDQSATVDFAIEASAINTLNQVVVTATGAQRVRELGHVVAKINADSLVQNAPITSLSELLTARVPGLQVAPGDGGVVGGDVALRLRGQTTVYTNPQPIVIVDGVRYRNTNTLDSEFGGLNQDQRPFGVEARSPLNDINVNDIETVEVVKGPSASTLYGPDASNGVIVITTKRGQAGKAKWRVYAYPDLSVIPKTKGTPSQGYRVWGHNPDTQQLLTGAECALPYQVAPASCVLDSITVASTIAATPAYSVIAKSRPQWHSGASVGGGTSGLTYFFSGNMDSQTGALQLSPVAETFLRQQLGVATLADAMKNPNTQKTISVRTSITSQLSATSSLQLSGGYSQVVQRGINVRNVYDRTTSAGIIPIGVDTESYFRNTLPNNAFLQTSEQQGRRFNASLGGTFQPFAWLTAKANIGTDIGSNDDHAVEKAGAEGADFGGQASDYRRDNIGRSADAQVTTIGSRGPWSFRTSLGTQYIYSKLDGVNVDGSGLAPGSTSISTATSLGAAQIWSEVVNLGSYGEETIGLNDRLYLTGSVRLDGSTSFGDAYRPRPFPKAGVSWVASEESFMQWLHAIKVNEFRLRSSYGVASRYPNSAEKFGYIQARQSSIDGQPVNVFDRKLLANPAVRPEKTREFEYGADFTMPANIQLSLAWYNKRTQDQLSIVPAPFNYLPSWANVGTVAAHGFEATASANLWTHGQTSVDIDATYSHTTNKLVSRGSAKEIGNWFGSVVAGYPLDASFGQTVASFSDTAHGGPDGIIEPQEVTSTPVRYLGVLTPPNVFTVTPKITLFNGYIRVSALFDRQTGGLQLDRLSSSDCMYNGLCVAPFLKTTPLAQQARYVAGNVGDFLVSSDFTRWQEMSVTLELPHTVRQKIRLSRASVSAQVRNLALWTSYKGPDPETVPGLGVVGLGSASNSGLGIPQARTWGIRFDIAP